MALMEKLIPIVIPNIKINKVQNGKYINYIINGIVIRGQELTIKIPNEETRYFEPIFKDTDEAMLAVHKYHRYDTHAPHFVFYAYAILDNEPITMPFQLEDTSSKIIMNKAIEIANKKYDLGIEKNRCKYCGSIMTKKELEDDRWQYCTNCYLNIIHEI